MCVLQSLISRRIFAQFISVQNMYTFIYMLLHKIYNVTFLTNNHNKWKEWYHGILYFPFLYTFQCKTIEKMERKNTTNLCTPKKIFSAESLQKYLYLFLFHLLNQSVCCCRRKWNCEFCLNRGGGSTVDGSTSSINRAISSKDIGTLHFHSFDEHQINGHRRSFSYLLY